MELKQARGERQITRGGGRNESSVLGYIELVCVCRYIRWLNWRASGAINRHRGKPRGEYIYTMEIYVNLLKPYTAVVWGGWRFATKPLMARAPSSSPPSLPVYIYILMYHSPYFFWGGGDCVGEVSYILWISAPKSNELLLSPW
jgi:hypothetical protein